MMQTMDSTRDLNPKQKSFATEYLVDLNATQAAIRAGYSENTAGSQAHDLLKKPEIQKLIQAGMDQRAAKTEITAEYVLTKIKETIERCSQAEPVMVFDKDSKQMVETGEWQFKEQGVLKGCELLGRHLKLFTDKVEAKVEGAIDLRVSVIDVQERIRQLKGDT